jgi:hypothetical protein
MTKEEWISLYEIKNKEKFELAPGWRFEYYPDKGFLVWNCEQQTFKIGQVSTKDWAFWGKWIFKKAESLGCSHAINAAVKMVADAKGLTIVVDKNTAVYGGQDITDDVLKKITGK